MVTHARAWLISLAWLAGCSAPQPAPPPPAPAPAAAEPALPATKVVARVNGREITRAAFAAELELQMRRYRAGGHELPPSIEARVRDAVLERMVEDALFAERAMKLGISIDDHELRAALAEHKSRFRSPQAFAEHLSRTQRTEDQVRDELRRQLLRERVVARSSGEVQVDEEEVNRYFEEHRSRFVEREQIHASRIVLRPPSDPTELEQTRETAERIQREASGAVPETFANLARKHSHGPRAGRGGDLGWFARGRMPPAWDEVAFQLDPGTVSPVVRTNEGFEIIAVWQRRPERHQDLSEVAAHIEATIAARKRDQRRRAVLRELESSSEIELLLER